MFGLRLLPGAALLCCFAVSAQTYTPGTIRLQGAGDLDQAQILHIIDLKPGDPVTKEQIEAAMQRLADSGLFTNLSYRVDSAALTFSLDPAPDSQAQPVRYANFVFWRPGELEPLVEARVPLFHGSLPLTGQLTTQVEAALVSLLADKGVTGARVEAVQSALAGGSGVALIITQPEIRLGEVKMTGAAPGTEAQLNKVVAELASRDFDLAETPKTLMNNTLDTYRNAGYLDARVDPPVFSAPHRDLQGYAVDAGEAAHPGDLYHLAAVRITGVAPELEPEVARATTLKVGDPAGMVDLKGASGLAVRYFVSSGHLEAASTLQLVQDHTAHTVQCVFTLVPGPVYTFAGIDTTALSAIAQDRFKKLITVQPGAVADRSVTAQIVQAAQSAGVSKTVSIRPKLDRSAHTVTYVVLAKTAVGSE